MDCVCGGVVGRDAVHGTEESVEGTVAGGISGVIGTWTCGNVRELRLGRIRTFLGRKPLAFCQCTVHRCFLTEQDL